MKLTLETFLWRPNSFFQQWKKPSHNEIISVNTFLYICHYFSFNSLKIRLGIRNSECLRNFQPHSGQSLSQWNRRKNWTKKSFFFLSTPRGQTLPRLAGLPEEWLEKVKVGSTPHHHPQHWFYTTELMTTTTTMIGSHKIVTLSFSCKLNTFFFLVCCHKTLSRQRRKGQLRVDFGVEYTVGGVWNKIRPRLFSPNSSFGVWWNLAVVAIFPYGSD